VPVVDITPADAPPDGTLDELRELAKGCTACPLYANATQTVFGEGSPTARIVFVGEQPGDREDLAGHPFVGPAGAILDKGLAAAGIDRSDAYITNVVKHFKWKASGKRRLHSKPNQKEIGACLPWLERELDRLHPAVLVALGATAAQALFGKQFRITADRGKLVPSELAPAAVATIHPSAILRARTPEERHAEMERFVADLRVVAGLLAG
jgi:uracil-DNA glycosylase family protein